MEFFHEKLGGPSTGIRVERAGLKTRERSLYLGLAIVLCEDFTKITQGQNFFQGLFFC